MISGRVLSVNVSPGGVPKLPVAGAWVGEYGLEGDRHREDTVHGGPLRAVCLFAIEVIERLQAEGHPTEIGGVGENLTTTGVEWSRLPGGTRVKVGSDVVLELTAHAMPCDTQRPNFIRGEFRRISPVLFPDDARMYARVVTQGEVRPGDSIEVLPLAADHDPDTWERLARVDAAELTADGHIWAAAAESGLDIHVSVDHELGMAATPDAGDAPFNHAVGLRSLPNLLPRVLDFYRMHEVAGWFGLGRAPWPGAEPQVRLAVLAADIVDLPESGAGAGSAALPGGVEIHRVDPERSAEWTSVVLPSFAENGLDPSPWRRLFPRLLSARGVHALVAVERGAPIAAGLLSIHKKVGLLRSMAVVPHARGRGLQRALIAARIQLAAEDGCDLIAAHAGSGTISEGKLRAAGLRRIDSRDVYRFDPALDPVPETTERVAAR